jgi:hypothetical protein
MPTEGGMTVRTFQHLGFAALALAALGGCDKAKDRKAAPPVSMPYASKVLAGPRDGPPMPPLPAWTRDLVGKPLASLFPGEPPLCVGNTDNVQQAYGGASPGVQIVGWGWDPAAKAPIPRILLVGPDGLVAGGGEPGIVRPDVNAAKPEITSPATGWAAYTARVTGPVDAYGVIGGKTLCRLGRVTF